MTRLEKFNEMREAFKNELLKTFPEISDRPAAINWLMGSRFHEDCEGLKCPEDGDCDKCPLKNYWTEEYGSSPVIKVGDEVYYGHNSPFVVTNIYTYDNRRLASGIGSDGTYYVYTLSELKKTGWHHDEIIQVLEKIKSGELSAKVLGKMKEEKYE